MRKTMHMSRLFLLAGFLFLYACKKSNQEQEMKTEETAYPEMAAKVKAWLSEKQQLVTDSGAKQIEALKNALITAQLSVEAYRRNEKLVVVPIGKSFKSANNNGKNPVNYLVVVLAGGKLTKGNVIQFISSDDRTGVPHNTFSKIFTRQKLGVNGQFSILSITDGFVYELKFEGGRLKSVADEETKWLDKAVGKTNSVCIDWYLVTTYYDDSGNVIDVVEVFLFQTCGPGEDCRVRNIGNINFRTSCGGGGGNGNDIDYEYERTRYRTWTVYTTPNGKNIVSSTEILNGTKAGDSSTFSSIRHDWADVYNTVGENDQGYAHYSSDNSWTHSLSANKKTGTTSIAGYLIYPFAPEFDVPLTTKTWTAKTDL